MILGEWGLIEADLHERYGIDVEDDNLLSRRSWRWLRVRISGLLAVESRLHNKLNPPKEPPAPRRR